MPYKVTSVGKGKVRVSGPGGVHATRTTPAKAQAQLRLLRGVEHGWKPTGKPSRAEKRLKGKSF
jgi:hypothetical protein